MSQLTTRGRLGLALASTVAEQGAFVDASKDSNVVTLIQHRNRLCRFETIGYQRTTRAEAHANQYPQCLIKPINGNRTKLTLISYLNQQRSLKGDDTIEVLVSQYVLFGTTSVDRIEWQRGQVSVTILPNHYDTPVTLTFNEDRTGRQARMNGNFQNNSNWTLSDLFFVPIQKSTTPK